MKQHKILLLPKMIIALSLLSSAIAFADNGKFEVQPGQMVTLAQSGATCANPQSLLNQGYTFYAFDTKINPDLSFSPFSIPAGYAFVITDNTDGGNFVFNHGSNSLVMTFTGDYHISDLVAYPGTTICSTVGAFSYGFDANDSLSRIHGHLVKIN